MLRTNVDAMLELLKPNTPTALADISKRLGTPETIVEKIAKYLEEEGILKIHYKFVKPYLVLLKPFNKNQFEEHLELDADVDVKQEPKEDSAERIPKMVEEIESSIKKGDFLAAGEMYMRTKKIFGNMPQSKDKGNLQKRLHRLLDILINSPYWKPKEK